MNMSKSLHVGVMPLEEFKRRSIAIAKGEENQALLKLISEEKPQSITELESLTGRKTNNLLRTLRTMENYGFVKLEKGKSSGGRAPLIPRVRYDSAKIKINWH